MTTNAIPTSPSVPGQRPPLDPDENTVAIPRPADELDGDDIQDTSEDEGNANSGR
jgi:hypothetical protein